MIARTHCVVCHATGKVGESPLKSAPPFRILRKCYPAETLEEPLVEGIVTGHPSMPELRFQSDQIGDFIAYLRAGVGASARAAAG